MPCQHYSFELESLELAADSELAVTVPLGPGGPAAAVALQRCGSSHCGTCHLRSSCHTRTCCRTRNTARGGGPSRRPLEAPVKLTVTVTVGPFVLASDDQ